VATPLDNNNKDYEIMEIMYSHNKSYGTFGLILTRLGEKRYIIDMPNPVIDFRRRDSSDIATEFQMVKDNNNPKIRQMIAAQIDSLIEHVKNKHTEAFAVNTIYRGDDEKRQWKDVFNPDNADELKAAKEILTKFKEALNTCEGMKFHSFRTEKESEGIWHVYSLKCKDGSVIDLAFLKFQNKYVLGDIDITGN
jgi:hypothetical protein